MQVTTIITTSDIERLKQKARKLKRTQSISHTQALDEVAKQVGLNHWHHVIKSNEPVKTAETALISGCVMAFDVKDGMDVDKSSGLLIEDYILDYLTQDTLLNVFSNLPDEDDEQQRPLKETLSEVELYQDFLDYFSFTFFRLDPEHADKPLKDILAIIREHSFWMPNYIWLKGQLIDTYHIPSEDHDGNIAGIRL